MATLKVARPFTYNTKDPTTSAPLRFEYGIGVYDNQSDEFVADPWVIAHNEASVLADGRLLFQYRTTIDGLPPVPLFLSTINADRFSNTIEAGWPILFRDDIDCDLENPGIDDPNQPNASGRDWAVGRHSSLMRNDANELLDTIKLFPGDASPPVSRAVDTTPPVVLDTAGFPVSPANKAHMARTLQLRRMQQVGRARAAAAEIVNVRLQRAGLTFTPPGPQPPRSNPNERPPPTPSFDWSQHVYIEPERASRQPVANVAAPPQGAGVPWFNVRPPDLPVPPRSDVRSANARLRARGIAA